MLSTVQTIFFVGIKGVAMANLALILQKMGKKVSGSDVAEEFITDKALNAAQIGIITSFEADSLPSDTQLIIYSASHGGHTNPQILEAKQRGIQVLHQAELIGELLQSFKSSIAVAGCHGKTTTSGMLAYTMIKLGASSSHLVGVSEFNDILGGKFGGKEYFVYEADEYGIDPPENTTPKFELTDPDYAIVTNIDFDHPDIYDSFDDTVHAFERFMSKIATKSQSSSHLVLNGDDVALRDLSYEFHSSNCLLYGSHQDCDVRYSQIEYEETRTRFRVSSQDFDILDAEVTISLFGEKNVANATGVITMLLKLGFPFEKIREAIQGYTGAKRRLELKFHEDDIYLFDDYAHHPAEIEATIKALSTRFPNRKVVVIFQPHTFTRTEEFKDAFVESLSQADHALLLPIFASAREKVGAIQITSNTLVEIGLQKGLKNISAYESKDQLLQALGTMIGPGDIICTMGAGDVYKLEGEILKLINEK